MGYDNECVVNISSLPGEYFCPVCRTLIYPNEALQSQCTHLYCKPCLAYVVATNHACPYDGYLVTEADSKPLVESSKELAETIGKTAVHCLYHRSGCQWQGTLAESTVHCAGCNYGNSAVVCNRCGTQIIHRQVQEHAQICPGNQPQAQVAENAQAQAAAAANQAATQDPSSATSAAATAAAATTATTAATPVAGTMAAASAPASSAVASASGAASAAFGQLQAQGRAVVYPQATAQAPTPEQWYQQQQMQYQQYYQQYPGYDTYQQQYQQYAQYQQQAYPQYMQPQMQAVPQHVIPGQQQPQPYMQQPPPPPPPPPHLQPGQPQPQAQPQTQPQSPGAQPQLQQQHLLQPQPQPHPLSQPQAQPQPQVPAQIPQMQTQQPLVPPQQPHAHAQPPTQPPPHGHAAGQQYPQPQPHAAQARPPQLQAPPQHQKPIPPQQFLQQMPHPQAFPQPQLLPQHPPQNHPLPHPQPHLQQAPMQMQPQPQPLRHTQPTPQMQPPQPPAVSGYQSYPQPIPAPPQLHSMQMHPQQRGMPPQHPPQCQSQFPPQQPPQVRPSNSQMPIPVQQQPAMPPPQGPQANLHPSQQQVQHPVHQPGQQVFQQSGMQPHGNPGFPQPQAQGSLHPGHPPQQEPVPPQHQLHPQQSLRPQGQAYMQQPAPGQPHQQLNAPPAQGLAQARPMMVSQGMPHQPVPESSGAGSKLMQPGVNQQSLTQNYIGRANPSGPMSSELLPGSLQQSQLPHSGSQGGLVPASLAIPKQGTPMDDGKTMKNAESTQTGEKISEDMFDSKSKSDEGKDVAESKEKDGQAENDSKDVLETLQKEENVDRPMVKQVKVEEGAERSGEVTETSHGLNVAGGEKEIQGQEGKRDAGPDKSVQQDSLRPNLERTNQGYVSNGHFGGTVVNNMHPPQQMQAPGALDGGQLQQQPTHQNVIPAQGRGYPQPGYNDRNPIQFSQQYPGPDDRQMPPGFPQQIPYGHPPHMSEPAMMSQRPHAPDRMFPQPMHQSSQERRFPEPSYQMHLHGQAMPPSQLRPSGHNNVHETFPHQGQTPVAEEPFWPPPHAGVSGPGPLAPSGGVPSHGFPPKGFDQQAMPLYGQAQSHLPPPRVGGARAALGDPLARPFMAGPPPGPLDTPGGMTGGPAFISEDKVGNSATVNAMEAEAHKRPGVYDGRQLEPHRPLLTEHAPYREPNIMKMNGMSSNVPVGGMHDSAFPRGLPEDRFRPPPEERFKPFPEEGFKAAHDEHFRPSALDPGRHIVNRREFEEDLKQFPRPAHLDGEGPPRFDGNMSSSRPLDRMAQQPGGPNAMTSRPMPSYQPCAPFPPGIGGSEVHMDIGDRDRPIALHEHLGRRHDGTFPHPDRLNLVPEFGRHRADGLPPLRSPGHFSRDIPDGLPSQLRRGMDGLGPFGPGLSSNIQGDEIGGSQIMPSFLRVGGFGGFHSHLDIGEPGGPQNLPSHLRIGYSGFNRCFSSASREGDIDSFEQSRKRKAGSTGRCLICKIDCETVEGLELHSQGREHQKMAMDMVLNIKKENAKKHRTSENSTPFEGANKSRKSNFEKRANRQ